MNYKRILSYISSIAVFLATAFILLRIFNLDTTGMGITNGEFIPARNAMFAIAIPCFVKFYISSDKDYKESKLWLLLYGACVLGWLAFVVYIYRVSYFVNIRTMCLATFVLVILSAYLQYGISKRS